MSFHRISDDQRCAEQATLLALINGFLREIDPGQTVVDHGTDRLKLSLSHCHADLYLDLLYQSKTGPHDFGRAQVQYRHQNQRHTVSTVQTICLMAQECAARIGSAADAKLSEFLRSIFNSNAEITSLMQFRSRPGDIQTFLHAEQGLTFGHWLHPTPKSRDGMTVWQQKRYAPEQKGTFQLHYFAVARDIWTSDSAVMPVAEIVTSLLRPGETLPLAPNEQLLPMHPLQADALRLEPRVQALIRSGALRDLGAAGRIFSATSSVRTLYAPDCPWMVKFSIPVRLTNSLRVTLSNELQVGVVMARLLRKLDCARTLPRFAIIDDPAYATVTLADQPESGFETIFRQNPFMAGHERDILNVATLTADAPPGEQTVLAAIIQQLSHSQKQGLARVAKRWFDAYLDCMLDPLLMLYDHHGIALEAHQQNALLDLSDGFPTQGYYRDNQGYFITKDALPRLQTLEPALADQQAMIFDQDHINQRFAYYLVVNQIFAVVRRLGRDGLLTEAQALHILRSRLRARAPLCTGAAKGFVDYLLTSPDLATKANLLTRLHDVDELHTDAQEGLFLTMPNPLHVTDQAQTPEVANVFA